MRYERWNPPLKSRENCEAFSRLGQLVLRIHRGQTKGLTRD